MCTVFLSNTSIHRGLSPSMSIYYARRTSEPKGVLVTTEHCVLNEEAKHPEGTQLVSGQDGGSLPGASSCRPLC